MVSALALVSDFLFKVAVMPDPDYAALREILPELEEATDRLPDELYAHLTCALRGLPWKPSIMEAFTILPRERLADVSLGAAVALVDEVLPGWTWSFYKNPETYSFKLAPPPGIKMSLGCAVRHKMPCMAILTALVRAALTSERKEDA